MDWLNPKKDFSGEDLGEFDFCPDLTFFARTFHIQRPQANKVTAEKVIKTAEEYLKWSQEVAEPSPSTESPSIVLVLHPRIVSHGTGSPENPRVTSLRQGEDTFRTAATHLFQHRSICDVVCRASTTVFTTREVYWDGFNEQVYGPSIVYNFRSDTESTENKDPDDIAMSVTWFPRSRRAFGTIYGCRRDTSKDVRVFAKRIEEAGTALHPLLMPMMFFELERKRLFNNLEAQKCEINQKILDMERGLSTNVKRAGSPGSSDSEGKGHSDEAEVRHEITELRMRAGAQRAGLESLGAQLGMMIEHSRWLSQEYFTEDPDGGDHHAGECKVGRAIEARLQVIMAECDSKARSLGTLLEGINLATQMEWNYHARMDARANYLITSLAKKDSGQMRIIAILGMLFLPPTFLASFFSMTFFKWIPENSNQMVSPFLAIWAASAFGLMLILRWRWKVWSRQQKDVMTLEV